MANVFLCRAIMHCGKKEFFSAIVEAIFFPSRAYDNLALCLSDKTPIPARKYELREFADYCKAHKVAVLYEAHFLPDNDLAALFDFLKAAESNEDFKGHQIVISGIADYSDNTMSTFGVYLQKNEFRLLTFKPQCILATYMRRLQNITIDDIPDCNGRLIHRRLDLFPEISFLEHYPICEYHAEFYWAAGNWPTQLQCIRARSKVLLQWSSVIDREKLDKFQIPPKYRDNAIILDKAKHGDSFVRNWFCVNLALRHFKAKLFECSLIDQANAN